MKLAAASLVVSACGAEFTAAPSQSHDDAGVHAAGGDGSGGAEGASGGAGGLRASGGTKNKGGAAGSGGASGTGGATSASGGSSSTGGGSSSTGGLVGTGGVSASGGKVGSGGVTGTGGTLGSGGSPGTGGLMMGSGGATPPPTCTPGALECDHTPPRVCTQAGSWQPRAVCGPLLAADVAGMDASTLPGFNAAGFRCKSLAVCGLSQTCNYFAGNLGSLQSYETTYTDGATLAVPEALLVSLAGGAASQCMNPDVTISAGESILLKLSTGIAVKVYFPKFSGSSLKLYIREDGATFTDAALTMKARGPG